MSSIDEAKLRAFFREKLVPAATSLRARGVALFPLGPDDSESFWEPGPTGDEFMELGPEEIAAALRERWDGLGLTELSELVDPLMALARELEVTEEPTSEVSPFVYVMY